MDNEPQRIEIITTSALEAMQRAEIDLQVATAKRYPRPALSTIKKNMTAFATLDEETAESCFYSLPRDGKQIQGPSVRLAEIAVACYGNLRAASRVIGNDGKVLTSQAACHDLENNTLISVEVQRRITDRNGKTYSQDLQVVAGNAANSIAFRNAVFKVIPSALIKPVYDAAKLVAVGDASSLNTKRIKMVKRLNGMDISTDRILARLNRPSVEDITLEDLEVLIGAGTAIRDGDASVDEAFPPVARAGSPAAGQQETAEQREARLKRQMDEQAVGTTEKPKDPEPAKTAEPIPSSEKPQPTGFWEDRETMMAAFLRLIDGLGVDVAKDYLNQNGIASDEDFGVADRVTISCFRELTKMLEAKQAAEAKPTEAKPKPTWGRGRS